MKQIKRTWVMRRLHFLKSGFEWTLLTIVTIALTISFVHLRASAAGGNEKLFLSVDFAHFRGDSSRSFLEVYYSFSVGQLHYLKDGDKFSSGAKLDLKIFEQPTNEPVFQKTWRVPYSVADTAVLDKKKSLVGVLDVWLKPDHYLLRLTGLDMNNTKNRDSLDVPMNLWAFPIDSLSLSDVELCSSIKQIPADTSNIFYKNTLEVIPNPSVLYGVGMPIMYYYVEAYSLLSRVKGGEYSYAVEVLDAAGHEVIGKNHTKERVHNSSVEVGTVNLGKLRTGTYTLRFSLSDSMAQQRTSTSKKFFVYNPGVAGLAAQGETGPRGEYISSEYALMDEKALNKEFEYARYIALDDEVSRFEHLTDLNAKKKFIYEFWKHRDPDPTTTENELKNEYLARVEYANQNFHAGTKEGWRTDRGRVYIMYGPPDDLERHPNEIDTKAYEVWHYHNIQGGVEFDFIDKSGFSDYILVNSTHRSEIRDDDWQQQLNIQ
jgi:GWxTD domain-containing protein